LRFSIKDELLDANKAINLDNISLDSFISRSANKMLHSIIVSDNEETVYQILFTGNRVVDIEKVRLYLDNKNITVDMRFYPLYRSKKSIVGRIPPLSFKQGIKTIIDESVISNKEVHIASDIDSVTNGYWVSVKSLIDIYPESITINISNSGSSVGSLFYPEGNIDKKNSQENIKIRINNLSIKPILFDSSIKEIKTINRRSEFLALEIEDLLRVDPCIYGYFLTYYFNTSENIKNESPTIIDIINSIGEVKCIDILSDICKEDNHLSPKDIDISIASSSFKSVAILANIVKDVIDNCKEKYPENCSQKGLILGRVIGYQVMMWLSSKGKGKCEYFSQQMKINPHRFLSEIQKMSSGYNQEEVSLLILNENKFPDIYKNAIRNYSNPIYQGDSCFYSNIMYIVSSLMVDKGMFELNQFTPIGNIHDVMIDKMGIRAEVNKAFTSYRVDLIHKRKTDWRFDWPDKEKKQNVVHPSYCSF